MIHGDGWLWLDDPSAAIDLRAGEIALVENGRVHHLADTAGAPCLDLDEFAAAGRDGPEHSPGSTSPGGTTDLFLCGAYRFAGDVGQSLLDALPPVLPL